MVARHPSELDAARKATWRALSTYRRDVLAELVRGFDAALGRLTGLRFLGTSLVPDVAAALLKREASAAEVEACRRALKALESAKLAEPVAGARDTWQPTALGLAVHDAGAKRGRS